MNEQTSYRGVRVLQSTEHDQREPHHRITQPATEVAIVNRKFLDLENDVEILKDQVAFLAKQIIVLHHSHAQVQGKLETPDHHDHLQRHATNEANPLLSVETQTDSVNSEDSRDSGCLTSSSSDGPSSESTSTSTSPHDSSNDGAPTISPVGEMAYSEVSTLVPAITHSTVHWPRMLLNTLIKEDISYTKKLASICRHLDGSPYQQRSAWCRLLGELLFRHTLFLELLACLKGQCCDEAPITLEHVMVQLQRFWTDQETIEAYAAVLCAATSNSFKLCGDRRHHSASAEDVRVTKRHLSNHIFFLRSYLKGVRDSRLLQDAHLEHVLDILFRILQHTDHSFIHVASPAPVHGTRVDKRLLSDLTDLQNQTCEQFHVEYMEGYASSAVTIIHHHIQPPDTAVPETRKLMAMKDEAGENPQEQSRSPGEPHDRRISWKAQLLSMLRQAYRKSHHLKPSTVIS